jgi:hypothetical protein
VVKEPMNKEQYETHLQDVDEKREIKIPSTQKTLVIHFHHRPNEVGPRSTYTGLPIWVGRTKAEANGVGLNFVEAEAFCWTLEPFDYSQARVVVAGRILKKLKLPTSLTEQVKE